jgi:ferritin-like metal-binding protein YciE
MKAENENTERLSALVDHLKDLWGMEQSILKKLLTMIAVASDMGLKNVLRLHFAETLNQTSALRGIFKQLDLVPEGKSNRAIDELVKGVSLISSKNSGADLDLEIIAIARNIELHEIDQYMKAISEAEAQGLEGIRKTLLVTLNEEKLARVKLDFLRRNIEEQTSTMHAQAAHGL